MTDFRTDGAGKKKKRGMGDRSGDGEGDGGVCSGRDFMDCRWGRSAAALWGRVWVLGSG